MLVALTLMSRKSRNARDEDEVHMSQSEILELLTPSERKRLLFLRSRIAHLDRAIVAFEALHRSRAGKVHGALRRYLPNNYTKGVRRRAA